MKKPVNILMVEDSRDDADLLSFELDRGKIDHTITRVWEIKKLESELKKPDWDLVLCDYYLPGFTGADAIKIILKRRPGLPVILVSGMVGEEKAIAVMKLGAKDYILKDNLNRLIPSVKREIHEFNLRKTSVNIERALETQTTLSQIFLDHIPASAMLIETNSYLVLAANSYAQKRGIVPGKKYYEYNSKLKDPCKNCKLKELSEKKNHINIESRKNGEIFDEHWVYIDKNLALHYSFDITERKQSDENLKESEEKYRELVDNALVGVFQTNISGDILFGNNALKKILGFEVSHQFSKGIVKTLYRYNEQRKSFIIELKKHKIVSNSEVDLLTNKGKVIHTLLNATINQDIISGTILDITEKKESELREKKIKEELVRAKNKAEESDRLKSAFLSNMSHEIRTPLNAILGFTQILKENKISEEERDSYIDVIEQSGYGMLELLSDILDFSRIESGNMIIKNEEFQIDEYFDELYERFQKELEFENKHDLKLHISKPNADQSITLNKDKLRLTQIINNLFQNSLKFTKHGFIEIGYSLKGKNIQFYIKDTGIGIKKEKLEVIFQRFRQGDDETTRKYGGAGLGLAISKSIVEIMGGKIWVESLEGTGSTFYFTLPVSKINKVSKHEVSESALAGREDHDHPELLDKTILIVEDETTNYLLLEAFLKKHKPEILWAKNGESAIDIARSRSDLDLILMDIRLPGINGMQATQAIRRFNSTIPIIAQTAFAFQDDVDRALKSGCNDMITKPINSDILLQKMKIHLKESFGFKDNTIDIKNINI